MAATEHHKHNSSPGTPPHRTRAATPACHSRTHLLPCPGRDLFFIIFGKSRHATSCQAPCPYKYASDRVYGDGWRGGLRCG